MQRHYITIASEARALMARIRKRHASPPERRRLHRLQAQAYLARTELESHEESCPVAISHG